MKDTHSEKAPQRGSVGRSGGEARERSVAVRCRVIPNAGATALAGVREGEIVVRLGAPPERGKANRELAVFLAKTLGVSRSAVRLTGGASSRPSFVRCANDFPLR